MSLYVRIALGVAGAWALGWVAVVAWITSNRFPRGHDRAAGLVITVAPRVAFGALMILAVIADTTSLVLAAACALAAGPLLRILLDRILGGRA